MNGAGCPHLELVERNLGEVPLTGSEERLLNDDAPEAGGEGDVAKSSPPPAAAEPPPPTPAQQVTLHQEEVQQLKKQLSFSITWDCGIVLIAASIALTGFVILSGTPSEYFRYLAYLLREVPLIGGLSIIFEGLAALPFLLKLAPWVKWEPWAVMTSLASIPTARVVAWFWVFLGTRLADRSLDVMSTMPEEKIRRELSTRRVELMLKRLKEYTL